MNTVANPDRTVFVVGADQATATRVEELLRAHAEDTSGSPGTSAVAVRRHATLADVEENLDEATALLLWGESREDIERVALSIPIVVIVNEDTEDRPADLVECGAQDVLLEADLEPARLARAIDLAAIRWRREHRLRDRISELEQSVKLTAHDVREDASLVVGRARQLADDVDPRGEARVGEIVRASGRLLQLTRAVEDVAANGSWTPDAGLVPVDLGRVVQGEVDRAHARFEGATIEIVGDVPTVRVAADDRLAGVIGTLLSHALLRGDPAAPAVTVSLTDEDDRAVLRIGADGPPAGETLDEAAFDQSLERADQPGNLDLVHVRRAIKRYDAVGWIEDRDPSGTIFAIAFQRTG